MVIVPSGGLGAGWHRHRHRPRDKTGGCSAKNGDFYLATSGDHELATSGYFFMAMDIRCPWRQWSLPPFARPLRSRVRVALQERCRAFDDRGDPSNNSTRRYDHHAQRSQRPPSPTPLGDLRSHVPTDQPLRPHQPRTHSPRDSRLRSLGLHPSFKLQRFVLTWWTSIQVRVDRYFYSQCS